MKIDGRKDENVMEERKSLEYHFGLKDGNVEWFIRRKHRKDFLPGGDGEILGDCLELVHKKGATMEEQVVRRLRAKDLRSAQMGYRYKDFNSIIEALVNGAISQEGVVAVNVKNRACRLMLEIAELNRRRWCNRDENGGLRKGGIQS